MSLRFCSVAVALVLFAAGCNTRASESERLSRRVTPPMEEAQETFALGTALTPSGAVAESGVDNDFYRGSALYLSVDVTGASAPQTISVLWNGPDGRVIRKDERAVRGSGKYVAFSTGPTHQWRPGRYHAVVVINGRKVAEKPFTMNSST